VRFGVEDLWFKGFRGKGFSVQRVQVKALGFRGFRLRV
jgi:hypothetical protein